MTETDISDGDFVLITTPHITAEQSAFLHKYVARQLAAGEPVVLEKGFDLQVRRLQPTVLSSEHYARVNELLSTINAHQERYRKAEMKLREMGAADV